MLTKLVGRFYRWLIARADQREERRMLARFPVGSRVRLSRTCRCSRRWGGQLGTVEGLDSLGSDYRVHLDGTGPRAYEFICERGIERA